MLIRPSVVFLPLHGLLDCYRKAPRSARVPEHSALYFSVRQPTGRTLEAYQYRREYRIVERKLTHPLRVFADNHLGSSVQWGRQQLSVDTLCEQHGMAPAAPVGRNNNGEGSGCK